VCRPASRPCRPPTSNAAAPGKVNDGLVFAYVIKAVARDEDVAALEVRWSGDDGVRYPWEADPDPAGRDAGGAPLWPGLHRDNAGHFGWRYEPNGLLTDTVSFDSLSRSYHRLAAGSDAFWQFSFAIPDAVARTVPSPVRPTRT